MKLSLEMSFEIISHPTPGINLKNQFEFLQFLIEKVILLSQVNNVIIQPFTLV